MKNKAIVIILITLMIAVYLLSSESHIWNSKTDSKEKAEANNYKPSVAEYVAAEGKVEAMPGLEVEVGSELEGRIAEILVNEGDFIKKGELIARLDNGDIEAKVKEAEWEFVVAKAKLKEVAAGSREEEIKRAAASLERAIAEKEEAEAEYKRHEKLYSEGVIPMELLDVREKNYKVSVAKVKEAEEEKRLLEKGPKAETLKLYEDTVKRTEATVEYCRKLLEKTYITAPISGKVIHKYLEEGEIINREIYMLTIADVEKIRVNAEVDETDIGKIKIGDPVEITSDAYHGRIFRGEIYEISDYAGIRKVTPNNPVKNLDMKVVQVKIEFKTKTPFKIGMTTDVKIIPAKLSRE